MLDPRTLDAAQETIGHRFADLDLLREALTHASIAESREESNERLEFLGDAVLDLVVCEHLYRVYPDMLEGGMTKIKSAVVSRRTCAQIARRMGLDELLRTGKGMQTHAELPSSVPAAAFESIVGAVYMDAGLDVVREFLMPLLLPIIERTARSGHQQNFKSALQQLAQERFGVTPVYVLLDEQGPDHAKCFEVCVQVESERYESCWGASKKDAEQEAALKALRALGVAEETEEGEVILRGVEEEAAPRASDSAA